MKRASANGGYSVTWHRVYFEDLDGSIIVTRVDNLGFPELGASDPRTVLLLEDYQRVGPAYLPKRLRSFSLTPVEVAGMIVELKEISVNSDVVIPEEIKIPAGTIVMEAFLRKRYVVGVDGRLPDLIGMGGWLILIRLGIVLAVVSIAFMRTRKERESSRQ